ncbi:hypothetical protein Nos7524_1567 [Nostoc sp. PCC 7524]|uniref:hypothetical protein n=1 Tax=Nostoc sp. (strain ATCC 29411 / PCC 7524) TaxID=28072 RepID=UPI00029ECAA4|nr:hypothetical protein [Nostoc sp. PCC 7524]AFY47442.1 hypothetical protein Nos7524_1567 [Nostoc sp. PCC 7524]
MSNRRYPPAYLRYLKARLLNLGRPSFWGTAIFLSVLGLVIQEYWSNPDIFNQQPNIATSSDSLDSSLSVEDRAIAADIDNLPLLFANSELINLPVTTSNSQDNNRTNPLANVASKQQSGSKKSNSVSDNINPVTTPQNRNIFVSQAENLLRFGATDNNQLLGIKSLNPLSEPTNITATSSGQGTELVNLSNSNQNSNSIKPLATGFNQPNASLNNATSNATNSLRNSTEVGVIQSAPVNVAPNQTFSPSTGINSPTIYTPQNTPNLPSSSYNSLNNGQTSAPSVGINTRTGYIPQNTPNLPPTFYNSLNNSQTFAPSTGINSRTGYIPQNTPNLPPTFYPNFNNGQNLPNQVQVTSPVITRTSPIIGPYTIRNPRAGVVTTTPVVPNNYGNSIWQQPNQFPQSNFPTRQPQGQ